MKVALISPRGPFWGNFAKAKEFLNENEERMHGFKRGLSGAGIGPLILAALTPQRFELDYIDENVDDIDFTKQYDIVAISVITRQAVRAYEIADKFRSLHNSYIVMGGIHATLLSEEVAQHADTVIIGEGEASWPQFLEDFERGQHKKTYKAEQMWDMAQSPTPRFDMMDLNKYEKVWIQTSRGCPHECEYCAASITFGSRFRYKTNEQVLAEIESVLPRIKDRDVRITFADDNFFTNRKRAKELLKLFIPLHFRWDAQSDISIADDVELLDLIRAAGCVSVLVGFESLSPENLQNIDAHNWKHKKLQSYRESIQKIQSRGIGIQGSFIVGLDHDTSAVFEQIKTFVDETNMYESTINICTPLPGTKLRERMALDNRILPTPWNNYTFADVNITHPNMTKEEIEEGLVWFYRWSTSPEFYMKKLLYFKDVHKALAKEAAMAKQSKQVAF